MMSEKRIKSVVKEFSDMFEHALRNQSIYDLTLISEYAYDNRLDLITSYYIHIIFDIVFDTAMQFSNEHEDTVMQILHYLLSRR